MPPLHNMAGRFVLSATAGAVAILVGCWLIIHGLPLLTRALDALTGG